MRKRYRKTRHWSPQWMWPLKDAAVLEEFEREWKGGRGFILSRRTPVPVRRANPSWEEVRSQLLADDPEARALHERDESLVELVRREMKDRGLDPRWGRLIAYRVIEELEDADWL